MSCECDRTKRASEVGEEQIHYVFVMQICLAVRMAYSAR
jgi:hypothetical protein